MIGRFWRNPPQFLYFLAMDRRTAKGFTLMELLVTVVVIGVVLGLGVPNFMDFIRNNRMAAAANEMVSGIYAARSEAVKWQRLVTLCGSANPMTAAPTCGGAVNGGFVVVVDDADGDGIDPTDGNVVIDPGEQIILQRDAPGGTINVSADALFVQYAPNGFIAPPTAGGLPSATTVLYCDERGNKDLGGRSAARVVTISATGRPQMFNLVADVANAVALLGAACP